MKNAYNFAVALEALQLTHTADEQIIDFAVAVGYYYTDEIENYLTNWNCHTLTRMLDKARDSVRDQAIAWQIEAGEVTDIEYLTSMCEFFEYQGKRYNLTDEFRENGII